MIVVTGATGKLGTLAVEALLAKKVPATQIVAAVRNLDKAAALRALGVEVRLGDYTKPETLATALAGAEKVLLVSSNEVGSRVPHHLAVVEAAKKAGVKLIAYTSILHADTSKLLLAADHQKTEQAIKDSGIPYVFLRNGWYIENVTDTLGGVFASGAFIGASGNGKIAGATRADFAAAAAAVLTGSGHENKAYELAGDAAYSMSDLAAEVSKQSGKQLPYNDLPPAQLAEIYGGFGLPKSFVDVLVDADLKAREGELDDGSHALSRLIGRPTTPLADAVQRAVSAQG